MDVLTPQHPLWEEFSERLEGQEGCDFKQEGETTASITWRCKGGTNVELATAILTTMEGIDVGRTLKYFADNGGHCNCEILFNVEASTKSRPA